MAFGVSSSWLQAPVELRMQRDINIEQVLERKLCTRVRIHAKAYIGDRGVPGESNWLLFSSWSSIGVGIISVWSSSSRLRSHAGDLSAVNADKYDMVQTLRMSFALQANKSD